MREVQSEKDIEELSKGSDKEKKIAATYGYQPVLDKLMKDESKEVADYASVINQDEDLKLYKADQEYEEKKSNFETLYKKYRLMLFGSYILGALALIIAIIALVTYFVGSSPLVGGWVITILILVILSVLMYYLAQRQEKPYLHQKKELSDANTLFEIAKYKVDELQKDIEKGYD